MYGYQCPMTAKVYEIEKAEIWDYGENCLFQGTPEECVEKLREFFVPVVIVPAKLGREIQPDEYWESLP